jgi:dienelactone hydrolase
MKRCGSILGLLLILPTLLRADPVKPLYPPPAEVRAAFLKLLDRPRVPLDVQPGTQTKDEAFVSEHLSFASEKKSDGRIERVPVLVVRPSANNGKRLPAVIVLHGTGGNKEGQKGLLQELARRGMIGVAIDGRYHGERKGDTQGTTAYNEAIVRAWRTRAGEPQEHPFFYDTCWDVWRTVDYLHSRGDVDPQRIGIIGFSKGGIETWLAAAVDERIKVAVPAIAVQSFRWSLDHDKWQGRARTIMAAHQAAARDLNEAEVNARVCKELWSRILPGILDRFDGPSMVRLFAGRPLLIVSGELDANCPIEGARLAFAAAEAAYKQARAEDRLKIMVAEGVGHKVTEEQRAAALAWFEKWLKE